jgi:CRP/FNR family transcriptional regulator, nitrogen oxide reductase regulator
VCATLQTAVAPRFFEAINKDAAAGILLQARSQRFDLGCTIISGGDLATHLFLVSSGKIKYYRLTKSGEEVLLQWLTPGDVFGLGTLLKSPPAYVGSAEALSDCDVVVWKHETIRKLTREYPQLSENALRIVLHYLKNYADRHVGLVTKSAEQRLAAALLNLGHGTGTVRSTGVEVHATNAQLAALSDVSHFTASRLLNVWQKKGMVRKHRGRVLIRAPESLLMD